MIEWNPEESNEIFWLACLFRSAPSLYFMSIVGQTYYSQYEWEKKRWIV